MGKLSAVLSVTVLASGGLNLGSWILDSSFCTPKGICLFQKTNVIIVFKISSTYLTINFSTSPSPLGAFHVKFIFQITHLEKHLVWLRLRERESQGLPKVIKL